MFDNNNSRPIMTLVKFQISELVSVRQYHKSQEFIGHSKKYWT